MRVLIIGGSGLISGAITRQLLQQGHEVLHFNRGNRPGFPGVERVQGDRQDYAGFRAAVDGRRFDAVIDMVCFSQQDAESSIEAFAGRTDHFLFCSTVCVYGVDVPPQVFIDENHPHTPVSDYAKGKAAAEAAFWAAHQNKRLNLTVMRPTRVIGPTSPVRHNTGMIDSTWDRLERGWPILCSGDGLGLFQPVHCDEVATAFVCALGREVTFGQAYNIAHADAVTWRQFYGEAAAALGQAAHLLYAPASWLIAQDPMRFRELAAIFRHHGVYRTDKVRRDIPEFQHRIPLRAGLRAALAAMKTRGEWRLAEGDELLNRLVERVQSLGVEPDIVDCRTTVIR